MYRVYRNQAAGVYSEAWKIETWYKRGQLADVLCLPESASCCLFIPLFLHFSFSPIFKHLNFSSHFSQKLCDLEGWNLAHVHWGRCIMFTRIRLLLLIHSFIFHVDSGQIVYTVFRLLLLFIFPFISSFFFLFNFQTFKIFVTLFSETMWPRRLKLGTHNEQMYRVYRNQTAAAYSSLYFSFLFLSNFQTLNFFVTLFSGTVRPWRLKLGTHVDSGQMYCVYRNQAAAAYLSLCFFIFLSLNFHFFCFSIFQFMICLSPQIAL